MAQCIADIWFLTKSGMAIIGQLCDGAFIHSCGAPHFLHCMALSGMFCVELMLACGGIL